MIKSVTCDRSEGGREGGSNFSLDIAWRELKFSMFFSIFGFLLPKTMTFFGLRVYLMSTSYTLNLISTFLFE